MARAEKVVISPVLDPMAPQGVDGYQIPDRIARAVKLRNPTVVFPFSTRASTGRHVQIDHVIPYPAGPTHTDNLAPETTRAHRAKTFGGYHKTTIRPGVYHWITPTGQEFWVTPHGTFPTDPDTTPPPARIRLADRARAALNRGRDRGKAGPPNGATSPTAGTLNGRPAGGGGPAGTVNGGPAGGGGAASAAPSDRITNQLPASVLQPMLIPQPDPRPSWDGTNHPPVRPDQDTPPPF